MPGSKGDFFERAVLDWAFPPTGGGTSFTPPTTLYVALCTGTAPTSDPASLAEPPSSAGYARVGAANGGASSAWNAAATNATTGVTSKTNGIDIQFPQATGSWGTITWFAIVDSNTTTYNILLWGTLNTSVTINSGDTAVFRAGGITIQED